MKYNKKVVFDRNVIASVEKNIKTLIGQVGGVDSLGEKGLLIFHRGNRTWEYK